MPLRDPEFVSKLKPILDPSRKIWEGQPWHPNDQVISVMERTSIQACHHRVVASHQARRDGPSTLSSTPRRSLMVRSDLVLGMDAGDLSSDTSS